MVAHLRRADRAMEMTDIAITARRPEGTS